MSYVYMGYYIDYHQEFPLLDYIGMSKSEYVVRQFLKQFNVDRSIYEARIAWCDEIDGCQELSGVGIYPDYDYKVTTYTTNCKKEVLLTPRLYMNWLETATELLEDELSEEEEQTKYNLLFALADRGIIRDKRISDTIKKTVLLLFKDYRLHELSPYHPDNKLDHIDFMIQRGYMTPPK